MADTLPDHLSNNPRSPFFKEDVLKRDVGVRFNGAEKTNVEEYCVSEGWIRVQAGKSKDRYGNPMTVRLNGKVEPYFKGVAPAAEQAPKEEEKPAKAEAPAKTDKAEQSKKADEPAKATRPAKVGKAARAAKIKPKNEKKY